MNAHERAAYIFEKAEKQGMDAQQIADQLRFSKALRFTHERRKPCLQTIENIMNSKMYSEFEAS